MKIIYAQDSLKVYRTIPVLGQIDYFEIDQIGNLYQVYKDEIIKLSPLGVEMYRYSNKALGSVSQLDVTNSLRPLVFYKELSKIVVLDNTLSEQDNYSIKLDEIGLYRALVIANSNVDNGVWMYDQDQKQILKVNTKLELIQESGNLAIILNKKNFMPSKMLEKNGRLYLLTEENGLLIFDIYCSYLQSLKIENAITIQIEEELIYYWTGQNLFKYNSKNHESSHYLLPKEYYLIYKFNDHFIALTKEKSIFEILK